jgi:hypothetical protein
MTTTDSRAPRPTDSRAELWDAYVVAKLREVQARLELIVERERAAEESPTIVVVPRRRWGVRQHRFGRR